MFQKCSTWLHSGSWAACCCYGIYRGLKGSSRMSSPQVRWPRDSMAQRRGPVLGPGAGGKRFIGKETPWRTMKRYEKIWIHLFPLNRFKTFHYVPLTFCPDSSWQKVKWDVRFQFLYCKAEEDEKRWAKSGVRKKNQNQPETKDNLRWYCLRWWWNEYGGRV